MQAHKKHCFYSFLTGKNDVFFPTDMIFLFKILPYSLSTGKSLQITPECCGGSAQPGTKSRARLPLTTLPTTN